MSKKNKKIKSRCHNCGARNKYSLKYWYGRDKTECKNCGEMLNKVNLLGETNLSSCKEVKQETMENQNKLQYNMIRPVRDNKTAKKKGKKLWIFGTLLVLMLCGWGVAANMDNLFPDAPPIFEMHGEMIPKNISLISPWPEGDLCLQVTAVPSWSKDGKVTKGGFQAFKLGVDYLIENSITFIYSSTCEFCKDPIIKDFGDDWQRYIDSGLTRECW